jgi:hypothetical protein
VLNEIWSGIESAAKSAWDAIKSTIDAAVAPVKAVISGVSGVVDDVIAAFNNLMGWDGKNLSSTTSDHTHTNTIVTNYITNGKGETPKTEGELAQNLVNNGVGLVDKVLNATTNPLGVISSLFGGHAKGDWDVPYDDYPALLHRNEMVLTASQARRYREGETGGMDLTSLSCVIVGAIREGMAGAQVNSYLDGKRLTDEVSMMLGSQLAARRFV